MKKPGKKGRLSGIFKIFSAKLHGKEPVKKIDTSRMSDEDFCQRVLVEIGGIDNLIAVDSCITRFRIEVCNYNKINAENLEALGCEGTVKVGENRVQLIFGEKSVILEKYYNKLKKEILEKAETKKF